MDAVYRPGNMFHHTVLLRLDPCVDAKFFARFSAYEAAVRSSCTGVTHYRLLRNEAPTRKGFDHALFSTFESRAAFIEYDRCALHSEIKDFLRAYVKDLLVADADTSQTET